LIATTKELVTAALNSDLVKHQVFAHNIANANSANYVPYELRFDSHLDQLKAKIKAGGDIHKAELTALFPRIERNLSIQSGLNPKVALDQEAAKLGVNVLHYQAVIQAYTQMSSLLKIAIHEGKQA